MAWDAARYLSFGEQRLRPAVDLIARIPLAAPVDVLDLGCGPGTVTRLLVERWPAARITGVDSSGPMLAEARELLPALTWIEANLVEFVPAAACDLVFSNAALHWLPDHPRVFSRLRNWIRPGGVLAVQMPDNFAAPSHRLLRELAASSTFRDAVGKARMGAVQPAGNYHELLTGLGGQVEIWSTEYLQALTGERPVLDWLRGTTLVPYLDRLGAATDDFLAELGGALAQAYPCSADGRTLFPFRRLFIVARF